MKKPHSLEVVRYEYDGDNIIRDYIKFAKLKEVMPYLSKYNVKFKQIK
jgi:hypothetical protein